MPFFDCQRCGACCCNTDFNRGRDSLEYIEVIPSDVMFREHRDTLKELGVRNAAGAWHLKLVGDDQRCIGFEGTVGEDVACTLYPIRPDGCRRVDSGDEECLKARRRAGFPNDLQGERARLAKLARLER